MDDNLQSTGNNVHANLLDQGAKMQTRMGSEPMLIDEKHFFNHLMSRGGGPPDQAALRTGDRNYGGATLTIDGKYAEVTFSGVMMPERMWFDEVGMDGLTNLFSDLADNKGIENVLIRVNSPGGAVQGHGAMIEAAEEMADGRNVTILGEGCVCSGAYWFAMIGDNFYVTSGTQVGSIGVRNHVIDWSGYFEKLGLKIHVADTGELKSLGVMGTQVTEAQRVHMQERVDFVFAGFKSIVMKSRKMDEATFSQIGNGGSWYVGQVQAQALTDGVRTLEDIRAELTSASTKFAKEFSMSTQQKENAGPEPATTAELKTAFPNSSAEWREQQTEAKATMSTAAVSYAQEQEKRATEAEDAKKEAEEAAKKAAEEAAKKEKAEDTTTKSERGVKTDATDTTGDDNSSSGDDLDYTKMAQELARSKNIRFSQAALRIKKQHGEPAIAHFGGPPEKTRKAFAAD